MISQRPSVGGLLLKELQGMHIRKHLRVSSLSNQSLLHRIAKTNASNKKVLCIQPGFRRATELLPHPFSIAFIAWACVV